MRVLQRPLFNGPSDRVRTCGLMVPNHARYQLRYTRNCCLSARSLYTMFLPGASAFCVRERDAEDSRGPQCSGLRRHPL